MIRKLTSIILFASLLALGSSGLMMIVLNDLTFQLQMHPVHKTFGIIMCISAGVHIVLNFKSIKTYLKIKKLAVTFFFSFLFIIVLFVIGLNKTLDKQIISEIEQKALLLER